MFETILVQDGLYVSILLLGPKLKIKIKVKSTFADGCSRSSSTQT